MNDNYFTKELEVGKDTHSILLNDKIKLLENNLKIIDEKIRNIISVSHKLAILENNLKDINNKLIILDENYENMKILFDKIQLLENNYYKLNELETSNKLRLDELERKMQLDNSIISQYNMLKRTIRF